MARRLLRFQAMKANIPEASVWLPFAASAFALVFAVVILGDTAATIVLNGLATGAVLLCGAVMALIAMESRSRALLVMGQVFAGGSLATIVIFERLSLWTLPYLE